MHKTTEFETGFSEVLTNRIRPRDHINCINFKITNTDSKKVSKCKIAA